MKAYLSRLLNSCSLRSLLLQRVVGVGVTLARYNGWAIHVSDLIPQV
jgi:hypothetical protein